MNYQLSTNHDPNIRQNSVWSAIKKLWPLIAEEKLNLGLALIAILINSGLTIWAPIVIGHSVDRDVLTGNYPAVVNTCLVLLLMYLGVLVSGFAQTRIMGGVGQRVLFRLRGAIFHKLQDLPIAFFNQNKAGDLISRINNDTDKLNQFFSQSLMQFVANMFVILGAGLAMVLVNHRLGLASLVPAILLLFFIALTSAWVKRTSFRSLQSMGNLSAEIQESLHNFKVIIAFNRRDYFRQKFQEANQANYQQAVQAGIAAKTYVPVFGWATSLGQLIVIVFGLSLISQGDFTFGLLISYLAYVNRFYSPLQQIATIWSNFQIALAGWDRIAEILALDSNLQTLNAPSAQPNQPLLQFIDVSFGYQPNQNVLHQLNFTMEKGKTYALVGPTGGGKTTTASLIARLFDPTAGAIYLDGQDIRSYTDQERAQKIGFILQDPTLFTGTVKDNIVYGNPQLAKTSAKDLTKILSDEGLTELISRFEAGLDTPITAKGDGLSLGQKQLIAFIRAVLRHPDLLILDEATANIDTVTEQLLNKILDNLPQQTTKVIIAHRLNTIASADQIFFVNNGHLQPAGSLSHALQMLNQEARQS